MAQSSHMEKTLKVIIASLLAKTATHRRRMAQIPFEQKIKIVRRLQRRRVEIKGSADKSRVR